MKILIVDDEDDLRETLRDVFEDEGHEVRTAENGAEALAILAREALPDVVILDLIMPGVDGVEVHARMARDPRLCRVPVIISTSDPSRAPAGVPVMKKPIDLDRLLAAVQQHGAA
jgi:CheY-like chemotaxis protein